MKILLLGSTGQVGFELERTLAPLGELAAPTRHELDLGDLDAVEQALPGYAPDVIVNAAAYTAVDAAEDDRETAFRLNTGVPERLAYYAAGARIPLVHYSSDYVYPGDGDAPHGEDSPPGPLSAYGASKLAGDEAIINSGARHLILRTSWVYSARGRNFLRTMLRLGQERDRLQIVDDEVGAPTPARLIAQATTLALHRWDHGDAIGGVYHLAPRGATSWRGFACTIFERAAALGWSLAIQADQVEPISSAEYDRPGPRPLNSRLALDRIERDLHITLPAWNLHVDQTLRELV